MKQGKADLAIVQQDVAEAVFSGKALYEGKPYQDFRELCYLGSRTLYFLVPRLSTLSDIRGKAGYKHHLTKDYLKHLQKSLMDICQCEGLHQVDLLSPAADKITPQVLVLPWE